MFQACSVRPTAWATSRVIWLWLLRVLRIGGWTRYMFGHQAPAEFLGAFQNYTSVRLLMCKGKFPSRSCLLRWTRAQISVQYILCRNTRKNKVVTSRLHMHMKKKHQISIYYAYCRREFISNFSDICSVTSFTPFHILWCTGRPE